MHGSQRSLARYSQSTRRNRIFDLFGDNYFPPRYCECKSVSFSTMGSNSATIPDSILLLLPIIVIILLFLIN